MAVIDVTHLTKDYGHGRGVFDVSLHVEQGVCYGYLGPNGAGKTTTIRHLMGFSRPAGGSTAILGLDSWQYAADLKTRVGYLPGEIAFPKALTGWQFLRMQCQMRGVRDESTLQALLERFELDPSRRVEQMSLGVRRKLAVVTAFVHDPDVLILDEPTSGLDPVMQQRFIEFVLEEKQRGKTILLSSHIFHEVDATCDRISIIKDGRIVSDIVADDLRNRSSRIYRVTFGNDGDYDAFTAMDFPFSSRNRAKRRARVVLEASEVNRLLAAIAAMEVTEFQEIPFTLEDHFMDFYRNERVFEEVR